ncbi:E3 SUMO-protein ligase PIAS3 isoform X3 [Manis pentadactyla]|uniref:E3 SUMO-protein ligase PIAS3 isoform X3 n=1 Tax=Manis pentadactyla TaxID=143292 RepID=UPI00255C2FD5|nr:E3 SUMO-protein ligase PIAS3 isoform X3 [Manis pentadactyla]
MAELGELKHMVMSFRVSELQVLLGFAGRNKSGRKHELLAKALHLLKSSCAPSVQMKIKELYCRRFPRKNLGPSDLSLLSLPPGTPPVGSPGPLAPIPPALLAPGSVLGPKCEVDIHPPLPQPVHPDVTMKPLPFYEVYGELIRPTTLASTSSQRFEEAHFTFALTPQQVQQILTSREVLPGAKCDYTIQVQLRFCLCETSCPQEDYFPPNLFVKVNGKLCPLPNYSLSVYLVRQLTAGTLLQKLRAKGIRNPDHSRALIKEKLTADPDSEVATTSLRVSLMCPLGKMRLTVPCRALTCAHLQSFDAALYLQMNEKKPTWTCPVCDKKAPYESLIIDGLFMEILNSCSDCDEIQFMEDGSWCPMKPKKEASEVCPPPGYGLDGLQYSPVQEGNPSENKKKVEVIDLTIESSSDEEDLPPTKKHCPVTSAVIPALPGSKGVLTSGHQPSSVLRSPAVGTLGGDFLSSLPLHEYPPAFPLGADIQGLDLFSFLQTEGQHYGPSVITSLDEQDALGHFFQYRGTPSHFLSPLAPTLGSSHHSTTPAPPPGRVSSIVAPGGTLREGHGGPLPLGPSLTGCRSDIISLD